MYREHLHYSLNSNVVSFDPTTKFNIINYFLNFMIQSPGVDYHEVKLIVCHLNAYK